MQKIPNYNYTGRSPIYDLKQMCPAFLATYLYNKHL